MSETPETVDKPNQPDNSVIPTLADLSYAEKNTALMRSKVVGTELKE